MCPTGMWQARCLRSRQAFPQVRGHCTTVCVPVCCVDTCRTAWEAAVQTKVCVCVCGCVCLANRSADMLAAGRQAVLVFSLMKDCGDSKHKHSGLARIRPYT